MTVVEDGGEVSAKHAEGLHHLYLLSRQSVSASFRSLRDRWLSVTHHGRDGMQAALYIEVK